MKDVVDLLNQRIAELEAENERLGEMTGMQSKGEEVQVELQDSITLAFDQHAETEQLRVALSETVPVMQRALEYIEDFAKPLPPKLQLDLINTIIRASETAIGESDAD